MDSPSEQLHTWSTELGARLKEARERADLTQQAVAERLRYTIRSLTRWENGESDPGFSKIVELCALYKTSLDWLSGKVPFREPLLPGAILINNDAIQLLRRLVAERKTVHD